MLSNINYRGSVEKKTDVYHIAKITVLKNAFLMILVSLLIAFCIESIYTNGAMNWLSMPSDYIRVVIFILTFQCEIINYLRIIRNMEDENYVLDSKFLTKYTLMTSLIYGCFWSLLFHVCILLLSHFTGTQYNMIFGAHAIEALIVGTIHTASYYQFKKIGNMECSE